MSNANYRLTCPDRQRIDQSAILFDRIRRLVHCAGEAIGELSTLGGTPLLLGWIEVEGS
jgi:hypothetical protein